MMTMEFLIQGSYFVAAMLFILGLKQMSSPVTARRGIVWAGAGMVLYPLSAFRAMNKAALTVYENILEKGDQKDVVDLMQTRMELYDFLNYHDFEQKLDELCQQKKG